MNLRTFLTGDHMGAVIGGAGGSAAYFRFVYDRLFFLPGTGQPSLLIALIGFGTGFMVDQFLRRRHRAQQVQIGLAILSAIGFVALLSAYDFFVEWATKTGHVEGMAITAQNLLLLLTISSWSSFWCSAGRFGWIRISS